MEALKPTLLHTLELVVVFAIAYGLVVLFKIDTATYQVVVGLVVAALAKFARANEKFPLPDYVNE